MNELKDKYGDKLEILAMPSNQHGFQEWFDKEEIVQSLKHVRPGNGFTAKCIFLEKCDVNGANAHPLMHRLRHVLPFRNTSMEYEFENPMGIQAEGRFRNSCWKPASITDIIWNFESFLIAPSGIPHARFHPHPSKFEEPIQEALKELLE